METEPSTTRTNLRLLTRVHFRDAQGADRECFANIIELGLHTGRIEAARPLDKGCRVTLQVVFPGQRQYENRHVKLHYLVCGAYDDENLQYDLEAIEMESESRERLALFLNRDPGGGS